MTLMFSLAWFTSLSKVDVDMGGSLLESYFHCGTGKEDDPFVITRPKHWYNLIWLHDKVDDFNDHITKDKDGNDVYGYYFQIGYPLKEDEGDTNLYVYEYSDLGVATGGYSNTVNCTYLDSLVPLGSADDPFYGKINGNGMTVSNFKVLGFDDKNENGKKDSGENGYSDIGIFGYVGDVQTAEKKMVGSCKATYFTDFTIDITGCDSTAKTTSEHDSFNDNAGTHTSKTCNIGYLAGHIADSSNFTNVYINRTNVIGTNGAHYAKSIYGTFGKVDREDASSSTNKGYNYEINFNSTAFYNYFNSNWNSGTGLTNAYIKVQNTEYDNYYNPPDEKKRPFDGSSDFHAVDRNFGLIAGVGYNYELNGDFSGNNHTYSFSTSTLGYYIAEGKGTKTTDYDLYSLKDGKTLAQLNEEYASTGKIPSSLEMPNPSTTYDVDQSDGDSTLAYDSNYNENDYKFKYDTSASRWKYYYANNLDTITVNFSFPSKTRTFTTLVSYGTVYNTSNTHAYLKIDNDKLYEITTTISKESTSGYDHKYVASFSNLTVRLPFGTHHISFLMCAESQHGSVPHWYEYYGSYSLDWVTRVYKQKDFGINSSTANPYNYTFSLTQDTGAQKVSSSTSNMPVNAFTPTTAPNHSAASGSYYRDLVAFNLETKQFEYLPVRYNVKTISSTDYATYTSFSFDNNTGRWIATLNEEYITTPDEGFISDDDQVGKYYTEEDIKKNGKYNPDNIDIVGGGITFSRNCTTLVCEPESLLKSSAITPSNSDVTNKSKFYATKYCSNSIVIYVKNLAASDGTMGSVEFNYTLAVGQYVSWTAKEPSFKKGYDKERPSGYVAEHAFVDFSDFGDDYTNISSGDDRTASIIVRKETIQKASFCGIDEFGYIVAKFDQNGSLLCGDEKLIDRYVLCIGTHKTSNDTTINLNTRITSIRFKFRAEGYGGNFGTIEYRDSVNNTPVVDETIFTFYYYSESTVNFSISVSYTSSDKTYSVVAELLSGGDELAISFYLYDITNYKLKVNGKDVTASSYSLILRPPS